MYRIAIKWTEYAPKVLEIQDDIFAGELFLVMGATISPTLSDLATLQKWSGSSSPLYS
jgi:hypothetical protein